MQVFVHDSCAMIAAPVQCDVDRVSKRSHFARVRACAISILDHRHKGINLEVMSRGFRNADETQAASEQATASAIGQILDRDREQAEHSAQLRAEGKEGVCED